MLDDGRERVSRGRRPCKARERLGLGTGPGGLG